MFKKKRLQVLWYTSNWDLASLSPLLESDNCFDQLNNEEMTLIPAWGWIIKNPRNFYIGLLECLLLEHCCNCEKPEPQGEAMLAHESTVPHESSLWPFQLEYQTCEWRSTLGSGLCRSSYSSSWLFESLTLLSLLNRGPRYHTDKPFQMDPVWIPDLQSVSLIKWLILMLLSFKVACYIVQVTGISS